MNDTQRELLRLIAAGETTEDAEILKEAKLQAVYSMVNQSSPYALRLISHNIVSFHAHREVGELLNQAGIPYVVLKGAASASYYPEPTLRSMGDVDVLVYPADLVRAERAMENAGFVEAPEDNGKHKAFRRDGTTVEVHWRVNGVPDGNASAEAALAGIIEHASERDGMRQPSPFHHGIVILLHTVEHLINSGIGLRHLCDWCYFVNSLGEQEFEDVFGEALRSVGLWRFAQILTLVGTRFLRMPDRAWSHCDVQEDVVAALMDDILNAGNFGVKDEQRLNQAKLIHADGQVQEHALLPALAHKTKMELPACKAHPILLPGGMAYIAARHLLRIGRGRRAPLDLQRMVTGAKTRREVYQQLHLFETAPAQLASDYQRSRDRHSLLKRLHID